MEEENREAAQSAAYDMMEIFRSVTANRFDLTITSAQGEKVRFRPNIAYDDLLRILPALLDEGRQYGRNIILRPRGPGAQLIQLDDLAVGMVEQVDDMAFLILQTSPGNFQAWMAIPEEPDKDDFARRLRKGTGADASASGATRIAGSINFKTKHAPDYPTVQITASSPRRIVTRQQLEAAGLVAAPEKPPVPPPARYAPRRSTSRGPAWPSYQKCLDGAPLNHEKSGPDTSRADFMFCLLALDWGHSQEATTARLMAESSKAKENGEKYAHLTTEKAAQALTRNRSR